MATSIIIKWQPIGKESMDVSLTPTGPGMYDAHVDGKFVGRIRRHPKNPKWGYVWQPPTVQDSLVWRGSDAPTLDSIVSQMMWTLAKGRNRAQNASS